MSSRSFPSRYAGDAADAPAGHFTEPLKPALAVMGRAPVPGRVKTRLCPPLDPEQAAGFYECVMRDVLDELAPSTRWDTWVSYAERSRDYFRQLPDRGVALLPQRGVSLGERMHAVFVDLCHVGYRQVILVGSDIATLRASSVRKACDLLKQGRSDVVLGPAEDRLPDRTAAYYLIGLGTGRKNGSAGTGGLRCGIAWSTASVLEQTIGGVGRARQGGLELRPTQSVRRPPVWCPAPTTSTWPRTSNGSAGTMDDGLPCAA